LRLWVNQDRQEKGNKGSEELRGLAEEKVGDCRSRRGDDTLNSRFGADSRRKVFHSRAHTPKAQTSKEKNVVVS